MGNWSKLKADEKVRVIKFARQNGVSDMKTIRDTFNMYADGGYNINGVSQTYIRNGNIQPNYDVTSYAGNVNSNKIYTFNSHINGVTSSESTVVTPECANVQWGDNARTFSVGTPEYSYYNDRVKALQSYNTSPGNILPEITVTHKENYKHTQYANGGPLTHKKSTGGPLYPFSFEKNPFLKTPVVRYDEGGQTYIVKKGDTFSQIAQNVGVSVQDLQKLNPTITNVNRIREGQNINIPTYMFSEIFNTPQSIGLSTPQVQRTQPLHQQNTPIQSVVVPTQKGLKTAGPLDLQELAVRQAYIESRLRPEVVNDKGAYGLFQIMQPALDDYNRVNKTNYTLEDMKNADNNIKVRNWYMDYLSNLGFINKGGIQSDSVGMYKVLASFNAGAGNVKDALTRAKADGKDIYDSWDWVSYLWNEPREYADFILRGIETKGTNKNDSVYKAVSTAKSSTANKIRSSVKQ